MEPCHIHKRLPPVPIMVQTNPVHASPSHLFKVPFPQVFPPKPCTHLSSFPYVRYAPPFSLYAFLFNVTFFSNIHLYIQSRLF